MCELVVFKYIEARRDEFEAMLNVIKAPPQIRTPLQRISRAKRRRAAAHDTRRLPRRLCQDLGLKNSDK